MRIGRLFIQVHFYRKNLKIRGTKLIEIIPTRTSDSKGFILSFYFTHFFVNLMNKDWEKIYG